MWAKFHYTDTIKKGIENSNIIYYHECCFCFSRRSFCKKAGHPMHFTHSILKVPGLKDVTTASEFYDWLRQKIQEHKDNGRSPLFPGINRYHREHDFTLQTPFLDELVDFLTKKCERLKEEKEAYALEIEFLRYDNDRLQASSKNWMDLYQGTIKNPDDDSLLKKLELPLPSNWGTPKKKLYPYL